MEYKLTQVSSSYGSYGTYTANVGVQYIEPLQIKGLNSRFSLGRQKSSGYRYDTDFDNWVMSFKSTFKDLFNLSLGYADKDFGAYHFYAPCPSKERTRTKFASLGVNPASIRNFTIEPKIYYREHYDEFILIRENPGAYTNTHINYRYGGELTGYSGKMVIGIEGNQEGISSSGIKGGDKYPALGEHTRKNAAIYGEYRKFSSLFLANIGARFDYNSQYGKYLSPSLSLGYIPSTEFKIHSSIGKSFRAPSFTELYYEDPVNIGDSTLKAEQALSYEVGVDYQVANIFIYNVSVFLRDQYNLIDWARQDTNSPWRTKNIVKAVTKGMEVTLKISSFTAEYSFIKMDSELEADYISKYAFNYPEHQLSMRISQTLPFGIKLTPGAVFKKRIEDEGYYTLDAKLSKSIKNFSFSFSGTNLLNTKYEDISGVEMPGTWLTGSVKIEI